MLLADLSPDVNARIVGLREPDRRDSRDRGKRRRTSRRRVSGDLRLQEIGLRPGERIRVVQRAGLGGRLVGLGCARIAIDAATARHIEVEIIE